MKSAYGDKHATVELGVFHRRIGNTVGHSRYNWRSLSLARLDRSFLLCVQIGYTHSAHPIASGLVSFLID